MDRNRIERIFGEYGSNGVYVELCQYEKKHNERFIYELDSSELEADDILGQNVIYYLQLVLHRSKLLLDGSFSAIEEENAISLALHIRAHFELTGALGYLLKNLRDYYQADIGRDDIEQTLSCLILGARHKPLENPFESINVCTMIDAADRLFNEMAKKKTNLLRGAYDFLSEFCHPNSYGLIFSSEKKGQRIMRFREDRKLAKREFNLTGYLLISLPVFFDFYEDVLSLVRENESIPKITFCE